MVKKLPRKIDYVREALIVVSEYLRHSDYFSLTAFADRSVRLIPTSPGKDRASLFKNAHQLEYLHLGDETMMAEGLASAFKEIQQHKHRNLTNRIMLLTDGYTKDVKECYQWAKRAREIDLAITTMGVGASFNEDLLIPIAEMTGGNAYYLESPDQIPQAFRKELGSALSVSYRNLKLKIKPSKNVAIPHLYRVLPELGNVEGEPIAEGFHLYHLGHYDPNLPPAFLFEIIVPAQKEGQYQLMEMELTWDGDQMERELNSIQEDITIMLEASPQAPPNNDVMAIIDKVGAYRFGNYALEYADGSDRENAIILLQRAAARLADVGEASLSREMLSVAVDLQKKGKLDPNATKRIKYDTRLITRRQLD
jgi:Ca-activated chloride channel family protein